MQASREFASKNTELSVIERLEDIPKGMSEAEEAEYWGTHMLSEALLAVETPAVEEPRRDQKSRRISLVLDEDVYQQLKVAAQKRNIGYQTLLKTFVNERLKQEQEKTGFFVKSPRYTPPKRIRDGSYRRSLEFHSGR